MQYTTTLVDAHRPAMETANKTGLPQTVFYHPDWAYAHTVHGSKPLKDKTTAQYVTWLPEKYFF